MNAANATGKVKASAGTATGAEAGAGLVEVLIAVAILSVTLIGLLTAVSTGATGVATTEERVSGQVLARSQMEYVKSLPYQPVGAPYPTIAPPTGYEITVDSVAIPESGGDESIQRITVTVHRDGKVLLTVEGFKVDR